MPLACTCTDGFLQLGVVLHGQQRLVMTRFALQALLCTAGCHPNPGPVLIGDALTHVAFHLQKRCCN